MDSFITQMMALITTCSPMVHTDTMMALVQTESGFNPFAIAVVDKNYPKFEQPKTLEQAKNLISNLENEGKNFSVGLGQINSSNFSRFNVKATDLLDSCKNLEISQAILIECYERSNKNINNALSCYYSGNFERGYVLDGQSSYVGAVHKNALKQKNGNLPLIPSLFSYSYQDRPNTGIVKGVESISKPIANNKNIVIKNFSLIKQ